MFKQKFKATLIHFGLSLLFAGLSIGSIIFFFFPTLFINITDFREVASIVILVDLVLGPLLTFIVFKPNKKSLRFDLTVIATIQICAFIYGAYTLYQIHPVYITFNVDRFTLVSAIDAHPEKAQYEEYRISKLSSGKMAYSQFPDDPEKRNEILFNQLEGGGDIEQQVELYKPYKENIDQIISKSLDPDLIFQNQNERNIAEDFLSKHQSNLNNLVFIPINSPTKSAIIVLDKETAKAVTTIPIDPWTLSKVD